MSMMKTKKPEPSEIEYKNMRFLITDRPTDTNMDKFVEVSQISIIYFVFSFVRQIVILTLTQNDMMTPW